MTLKLFFSAIAKFTLGVVLVGALLFLPAGTLCWSGGWLLMVLLFLAMPLVLGSLPAFAVFLFYPFLIAGRIQNEEQLLEQELQGYIAYKQKVRYRPLPVVW